jgi:hyperosmotically inducible periplasmic protein
MKPRFLGQILMATALLAGGAFANTKTPANVPQTDQQITKAVRHELVMYPRYTVFDDIGFSVANGQVVLTGDVTQPFKKDDFGRLAAKVPGVTSVENQIQVLPLSDFDNRLRMQVARAIYADPVLSRYAMMPYPSIHIIVNEGHVTLTGVVANTMDKSIAGMRAMSSMSFGAVANNLVVENPSKKS